MAWLYGYSIRHPRIVIAVAVLVTLAISPGVLRLKLRTDGHALVPPEAPQVRLDRTIRDQFGIEDPVVVLIQSDDPHGIFNPHTVKLVQDLTHAFGSISGVRPADLFSLETEHNDRVKPGTLYFRRFLEPPWETDTPYPSTRKDLDTLRNDLREIQLFTGTLVSYNEKATSILIGVPYGASRTELYRQVHELIAAQGEAAEHIEVIGAPVAEALLGTHILEDLGAPAAVLGHRLSPSLQPAEWRLPRTLNELRVFMGRTVGLAPIAVALMAVVFFVSFRSAAAALLPMAEIGASLMVVFGLMGWFGVPIYLTIAVLPIILTVTGVTDEIHVFTHYTHLLREQPDAPHVAVVRRTMDEMWRPVLKASLTTAIGFLSFAISDIEPVWAFGVFTAIGLVFCMFWSLAVVPAMLVLIDPRRFVGRREAPSASARSGRLLGRLAAATVRYRYGVLGLAVLMLAMTPLGLRRLVVQDSWIDGFAPDSSFYRTTQYFNEQFLGTHLLLLGVEAPHHRYKGQLAGADLGHHEAFFPSNLTTDPQSLVGDRIDFRRLVPSSAPVSSARPPRTDLHNLWNSRIESVTSEGGRLKVAWQRARGSPRMVLRLMDSEKVEYEISAQPLMSPETIHLIGGLEAFIEQRRQDTVGGVIGTADYLSTIHFMSKARKEGSRSIPEDPERIEWLWSQYKRIRGEDRLRQLVDDDYARSLVTVFLKNANFVAVGRLMNDIRAYEREHLAPHGIKLHFAGDVAVSQTLIDAIVSTQVKSLAISLLGDFAVVALFSRSIGWGLFAIIPCTIAVLLNFAIMGWVGMPLGVATSMFAGMTLGVGVDYAIHLLERCRLAHQRGMDVETAIREAVVSTGRPLIIDALAVSIGFGVMMLSQVPANARLGGLVVMSIANSLAATLLLLPALLRMWRPRALSRVEADPPLPAPVSEGL